MNTHRSITVADIQLRLNVSRETVRRDLLALEQNRKLRRSHGGAISLESPEPELAVRQVINPEGKQRIGRLAAEMVPDGAVVLIGGGTTVQSVVEALAARRGLTVVTNCVASAMRLIGRNGNRVHLLGGEVQEQNQTTLGRDATAMLANYFADIAIVGVGAISRAGDLMDYSREEAELYGAMLRAAGTAIVVADHQKFGRAAPARVAALSEIGYLVTDREPEPAFAEVLGRSPAQILVAGR